MPMFMALNRSDSNCQLISAVLFADMLINVFHRNMFFFHEPFRHPWAAFEKYVTLFLEFLDPPPPPCHTFFMKNFFTLYWLSQNADPPPPKAWRTFRTPPWWSGRKMRWIIKNESFMLFDNINLHISKMWNWAFNFITERHGWLHAVRQHFIYPSRWNFTVAPKKALRENCVIKKIAVSLCCSYKRSEMLLLWNGKKRRKYRTSHHEALAVLFVGKD